MPCRLGRNMPLRILILALLHLIACSSASRISSSLDVTTCSAENSLHGMYCDATKGTYQALTPGRCDDPTDCPAPYNYCCKPGDTASECNNNANICVTLPAGNKSAIWFATDPIQPGVTLHSNDLNFPNDWAYNIMAKGKKSLNDWCLSQAQQSKYEKMRQVKSWKALVVSAPDTDITDIFNNYMNISALTKPVTDPSGTITYNSTHNAIMDKNGNPNPTGGNWAAWSGFTRDYCMATVGLHECLVDSPGCDNSSRGKYSGCVAACNAEQDAICTGTAAAICVTTTLFFESCMAAAVPTIATCVTQAGIACSSSSSSCQHVLLESHCTRRPDSCDFYGAYTSTVTGADACTPDTTMVSFSRNSSVVSSTANNWQSNSESSLAGVLVLTPQCSHGFNFATDCSPDKNIYDAFGNYYAANGSVPHSVICLADQSIN